MCCLHTIRVGVNLSFRLKNVQDAEAVAPDGSTIKGRMQVIIQGTADDIKACGNGERVAESRREP